MSIRPYYRDQCKMGQVIDQIKILVNNLDELCSEIDVMRNDCMKNGDFLPPVIKNNVLRRFKKYAKKVMSIESLKKERKSKSQEAYYHSTNSDPPMSSFLNYIFGIGKRNIWPIDTGVKFLRDEGNQTENVANQELEIVQQKKKTFPKKYVVTLAPQTSDISCELDSRVETSFPSTDSFPPNVKTTQTQNGADKQFAATSTQTTATKLKRSRKITDYQCKQPNFCLSKIKNAVITKKVVRNLNESTYFVCRNDYRCSKNKFCVQCSCDKKKRNNCTEMAAEQFVGKTVPKLKNILPNNDNDAHASTEEEELSSSSVSVDMEVNISENSSNIDGFPERRRPRTYVIRKSSEKRDEQNWRGRV